MRMPFTAALEKFTIGPDRSCAVPITISVGVTPCCASAGAAANNAIATANDFICLLPGVLLCVHLKGVDGRNNRAFTRRPDISSARPRDPPTHGASAGRHLVRRSFLAKAESGDP